MPTELIADLPEQVLRHSFDAGSLMRGRTYAAEGRVHGLAVLEDDEGYLELDALVTGSGTMYQTTVAVLRDRRGWSVSSDCSCPVGDQCKHGVAVVLVARGETTGTPRPSAWSRRLDDVLAGLEGARSGQTGVSPLALQVELGAGHGLGRAGHTALCVRVRPLRHGARGAWVKTGASWSDVASFVHRGDVDRRHALALLELAELRNSGLYYGHPAGGAGLGEFGPGVWPRLREVRDCGVELVAAPGLHEVSLADGAAELAVDVTRDEAGYLVRASVTTDGPRRWATDTVVPIAGAHGVGLVERDGSGTPRRLLLAPLARRLDPALQRLLEEPEGLRLPPGAAGELLEDYLPRLQAHLVVTSTDDSVALPPEPVPTLRLTVGWGQRGAVALTWRWCYRRGRHEHLFALDDTGPGHQRRPDLEGELIAGLDLHDPDLLLHDEQGRLRGDHVLRADELPGFVQGVLGGLRGHPSVEVVEEGVALDYRSAASEPEIRFEAADTAASGGSAAGPTDWLDLHVVITVDGHDVPLPDLLTALTLGDPAVIVDDGLLVWTDHPSLTRLAEAVRAAAELRSTTRERSTAEHTDDRGLRVGSGDLGLWAELSELGAVDAQAAQWVDAARTLAGFTGLPDLDPPGVVSDLRSYQLDGFRWLAFLRDCGLGGILADDMGLGKTVQALAAISHARAEGAGPVLVVAPTSVVGNWVLEAAQHVPGLEVRAVTASAAKRGTRLSDEVAGADVLVTSYTLLRLEVEQYAGLAWGGLVLDEAHQVKNHRGKTYQAVRCLDAGFRVALTGTPVENRLTEMWSLLSIVAPGLYPDRRGFTEHVATPVEKQGDADALARFRRRVRPFLLRRTKERVAADLPPKQEQVLEVALAPAHRRLYDARMQRERQSVLGLLSDFEENRVAIFAALMRLRQLSLHAGLVDDAAAHVPSAKLEQLVEQLREIAAEGHRALVFSQFTRFLRMAEQRLVEEGIECVYLDGTTRDRQQVVREFREGQAPAFLISLKAGGIGLTLTEADYVFVLDPWWNPAVEAQAVDRAHRIGQTRPVLVYRLVAADTIEEKVMALKARKAALVEGVLGDAAGLGEVMTAEDVRAVFDA